MADIDLMPSRGIPFRVQVGPTGIALNGTATLEQLAQRGLHPVCIVDNAGLNTGVTVEQLAQRGIRAACLVDENGLASGVTIEQLAQRGIRPLVSLSALGLSGSTTMQQLAQRGLPFACLVDETGMEGAVTPGAEATAFLARTSGLNATHTNANAALINGLVADGIWAKLDALYIYMTQDSVTARLSLVSATYNLTQTGSPTFTADRGFTGVAGSSTFMNTGFNPSTAPSPKSTQNSAHLATWNVADLWAAGADIGSRVAGSGSKNVCWPRDSSSGNGYFSVNSAGTVDNSTIATSNGFFIANRSASNSRQAYRDGVDLYGNLTSPTSAAPHNLNLYTLAHNQDGTAVGAAHQIAMNSIGSSLTAANALAYYNRLRTYATAVGFP